MSSTIQLAPIPRGPVVRAIVGHATETMTEHYSVIDTSEKHAVQAAVIRLVSAGGSRPTGPGTMHAPWARDSQYVETVESPGRCV